ncbi:methyltransferase domain-containing protein [Azoarcus indigens]|nr:methyltransferase domain-containing protein [Azoarcus indigens]
MLCDVLNRAGQAAYLLNTRKTHPAFNVRLLSEEDLTRHASAGLAPIVIYPEVVSDNPLRAQAVVRWMLNRSGALTQKPVVLGEHDLVYYYSKDFVPSGQTAPRFLRPSALAPTYEPANIHGPRSGALLYLNRLRADEIDFTRLPADIRILDNKQPISLPELIQLFSRSEVLYSAERSGTCTHAMLAGCPVLYFRSRLLTEIPEVETYSAGCDWADTPGALERLKGTVAQVRWEWRRWVDAFAQQLPAFIEETQALAASRNSSGVITPEMRQAVLPSLKAATPVQASAARSRRPPKKRPAPPHPDQAIVEEALQLQAAGDVGTAFSLFQQLVNTDTPLPRPYLEIARIALSQGERAIALEFLELAQAREQPPAEAHLELARLHSAEQRHEAVLAVLSPLLRQPGEHFEALDLIRQTLGKLPALGPIPWARLLADLRRPLPREESVEEIGEEDTADEDAPPNGSLFPDSALAHRLLDGKRGIEVDPSAHNAFHIPDCLFVDKWVESRYTKEQMELSGEIQRIDILAAGNRLPLANGSLDYVLTSHVLEHFHDTIGTLKEWYRVVRDGGLIFTIFPHKERTFDKVRPRTTLAELEERHASGTLDASDRHHTVWITEDAVELVRHLGWKLIEVMDVDDKVGNGFTFVIQVEKARAA